MPQAPEGERGKGKSLTESELMEFLARTSAGRQQWSEIVAEAMKPTMYWDVLWIINAQLGLRDAFGGSEYQQATLGGLKSGLLKIVGERIIVKWLPGSEPL
jgi:hypothetical protein